MNLPKFSAIIGAFCVVRRRAVETDRPGLTVWTDAGEKAAREVGAGVAKLAHVDEVADLEAAKDIETTIVELADGKASAQDLERLKRAARLCRRSAEVAHDIGEAVCS